jgi:glycosyltransferase involved in cell wall biosynthesis
MLNVSVIIPVFNDTARLTLCLDSISKQNLSQDQFEVIVIDNNSKTNVREVVKNFYNSIKNLTFLYEPKQGSYAARNRGIKNSKAEVLAFTDADCQPNANWLTEGVTCVSQNIIVGGRIKMFCKAETPNTYDLYEKMFSLNQKQAVDKFNYCLTANMFVHRKHFNNNLFPEDSYTGGDRIWCNNLLKKGLQVVYCNKSVVHHPTRSTLKEIAVQRRRFAGGKHSVTISKVNMVRTRLHEILFSTKINLFQKIKLIALQSYIVVVKLYEISRLQFLNDRENR